MIKKILTSITLLHIFLNLHFDSGISNPNPEICGLVKSHAAIYTQSRSYGRAFGDLARPNKAQGPQPELNLQNGDIFKTERSTRWLQTYCQKQKFGFFSHLIKASEVIKGSVEALRQDELSAG